jgi:hypothetical protein
VVNIGTVQTNDAVYQIHDEIRNTPENGDAFVENGVVVEIYGRETELGARGR